jgi:hypothetical protein
MGVAELLRGWSERGVTNLALLHVDKEEWLMKIPVPGLPEATAAFMDCYDALP